MGRILKFELNKIFIKQKGLLAVLLFVIIKLVFLNSESGNINSFMEENKDNYIKYMSEYSGYVDTEKEISKENEYEIINNVRVSIDKLYENYENGEISYDDFSSQLEILDDYAVNKELFNIIYNKYQYAKESADNRYLLYDNGWNALLGTEWLDIPLILLLLILITPMFCTEYETSMVQILLSSKNGRVFLAISKILLAALITINISIIFSVTELWFFELKYGLPNGSYPLQSLECFYNSSANYTLMETYISIALYRIIGYIYFIIIIILVSVLTKRAITSLFISGLCIVIPNFLWSVDSVKYLLPTPIGLILGQGYFKGNEYISTNNEQLLVFKEIQKEEFYRMVFAVFLLMGICILLTLKTYINKKIKINKSHCILLIPLLFLSGCSNNNKQEINYNLRSNRNTAANDVYISFLGEDFSIYDTQNNELDNVIRDPFLSDEEAVLNVSSIFILDNCLYYFEHKDSQFNINEIDLETHDEQTICQFYIGEKTAFLGSTSIDFDSVSLEMLYNSKIFLNEEYIFLAVESNIYRINRMTSNLKLIAQDVFNDVSFDGENIYYLNNRYQISILDAKSLDKNILDDIRTDYFFYFDNYIYYKNLKDKNNIYKINLDSLIKEKVLDENINSFASDNQYLYYSSKAENFLYRLNLSNSECEKMAEISCYWVVLLHDSNKVYLQTDEYGEILINIETFEVEQIDRLK